LGSGSHAADAALAESVSDSVKNSPQFSVEKVVWGNPLRIMLKKEKANEQGQSRIQDN
jgi:hypothetical protein